MRFAGKGITIIGDRVQCHSLYGHLLSEEVAYIVTWEINITC